MLLYALFIEYQQFLLFSKKVKLEKNERRSLAALRLSWGFIVK